MGFFKWAGEAFGLGDVGEVVDTFLVDNAGGIAKGAAGIAGAGASLAGAKIAADASKKAAETQAQGATDASNIAKEIYYTNRADFAPYRDVGVNALKNLEGIASEGFYESPGYLFRTGEGLKAIDRNMSARGLMDSGAAVKGAIRYASGAAGEEFGNWYNRLAGLAGIGQTATGQSAASGASYAGQAGNALQNAATARASGYVGEANAVNSGINNFNTLAYLYGR